MTARAPARLTLHNVRVLDQPHAIDVAIEGGRVAATAAAGALPQAERSLDADGRWLLPGLVNAHDHLDLSTLGPIATGTYRNGYEWAEALEHRQSDAAVQAALAVPLADRLFLGGLRNLLAGVTAVAHHGPFHRSLAADGFPVRALERYQFAYSPGLTPALRHTYRTTDRRIPWLVHVAEGTDARAGGELDVLVRENVLRQNTVIIHGIALPAETLPTVAQARAALVWCPEANRRLYGATADVAAMKAAGAMIGLGSDWSPSGSKNLLGELKVARLVSANTAGGPIFTDREIVAMATSTAARMLGWEGAIGSIEAGKRADLIAVSGTSADPYSELIAATERDLVLVMIGGIAACGQPHLVEPFTSTGETVRIGGRTRLLNFALAGDDPDVALVGLARARATLADALQNLVELARALEPAVVAAVPGLVAAEPRPEGPTLVLDEIEHTAHALRMHPAGGVSVLPSTQLLAAQPPLSSVLGPLILDGLTADDDRTFMETLQGEANLPDYLAPGLATAYARTSGAARSG